MVKVIGIGRMLVDRKEGATTRLHLAGANARRAARGGRIPGICGGWGVRRCEEESKTSRCNISPTTTKGQDSQPARKWEISDWLAAHHPKQPWT
jgi:hypothetical protein